MRRVQGHDVRKQDRDLVKQPLQVLIVEDSENDAALLEIELQRAGYDTHYERVETGEAMSSALDRQSWHLVIADYIMPHFNGLAATARNALRD